MEQVRFNRWGREWNESAIDGEHYSITEGERPKGSETADFEIIQFMKCPERLDKVDKALGCTFLRWSIDDEVYHTFETQGDSKAGKKIRMGGLVWFGMEPFDSIKGTVNGDRQTWNLTAYKRFALESPKVHSLIGFRNPVPELQTGRST